MDFQAANLLEGRSPCGFVPVCLRTLPWGSECSMSFENSTGFHCKKTCKFSTLESCFCSSRTPNRIWNLLPLSHLADPQERIWPPRVNGQINIGYNGPGFVNIIYIWYIWIYYEIYVISYNRYILYTQWFHFVVSIVQSWHHFVPLWFVQYVQGSSKLKQINKMIQNDHLMFRRCQ